MRASADIRAYLSRERPMLAELAGLDRGGFGRGSGICSGNATALSPGALRVGSGGNGFRNRPVEPHFAADLVVASGGFSEAGWHADRAA